MASRNVSETYIKQNVTTQQATQVAPVTTAAITVTDTYLQIDTPSAPGPQ